MTIFLSLSLSLILFIYTLPMALTPTNNPPRITIHDGQVLHATLGKRVVKASPEGRGFVPCTFRVPQEHAQQMAVTGHAGHGGAVGAAGMQDAQIVQELHVALSAIECGAEASGKLFDRVQGVLLHGAHGGHAGIAREEWGPLERGLDKLADRLVVGEEEGGA